MSPMSRMARRGQRIVATSASSATMAQQAGPTAHVPVELVEEVSDAFICVLSPACAPADVAARARVSAGSSYVGRQPQP